MYQKYVENDGLYFITNRAVARTSLFGSRHHCERFLYQLRRYLGPLGKVLGYALVEDEFSFVIRLGNRAAFEQYHKARQLYEGKPVGEAPLSTYIFSQAIGNLQSSTAKYFNRREGRSGAVFATRFRKKEIKNGHELVGILDKMRKGQQTRRYRKEWRDCSFDRTLERKSWHFNFTGLLDEIGGWAVWRRIQKGVGHVLEEMFTTLLQGRLRKSKFFTKISFDLPFLNATKPP